jgi:hypothetical protein
VTWQMGRKRLLATSNESPIFEKQIKKTVWEKKDFFIKQLFLYDIPVEVVDVIAVVETSTPFQAPGSNPWRATVLCYFNHTVYCRVVSLRYLG